MINKVSGRWSTPRALTRKGFGGLGAGKLRRPERTNRAVELARLIQSKPYGCCGLKWRDIPKSWECALNQPWLAR